MKVRVSIVCVLLALLCLGGCEYTKDGDADYVPQDDYVLPTVSTAEADSVPYVVAKLIAKGQVVRDYNEMRPEAIGALEAYSIRTNGITVEIYKFADDSEMLAEIKSLGAYPVRDDEGNLLATRQAVIRSHFVMMIPSDTNDQGDDISQLNERLKNRFEELDL